MVRRITNTKSKPKTVRTTKSEQYLVNKKYMGDEPIFSGQNSTLDYVKALSWYNYMTTVDEAREYLVDYLTKVAAVDDAKRVKKLNDSQVPLTAAFLSRMIVRGYTPSQASKEYLWTTIKTVIENINNADDDETSDIPKVSIQDRMRERMHDIIAEVEGLIDDYYFSQDKNFSFYNWLQSNSIPVAYIQSIISKLKPYIEELQEAYLGKDEQLKEGYRYYKKIDLKNNMSFIENMINDAERYANVTKKTRKIRKPRAVSIEKKFKTFKYQKEDNTFKIASVTPEKIVGAQELWAFNTKYKTLTVFRALDRGGLDVKGASIIKFDETSSFTMRTGRKPEEVVRKVLDGGKILLRKLDQELKNHAPLQSRINENTILLRIL
jgi:hypothetical protein